MKKRGKYAKWTPERVKMLREVLSLKVSYKTASEVMGVSFASIVAAVSKFGLAGLAPKTGRGKRADASAELVKRHLENKKKKPVAEDTPRKVTLPPLGSWRKKADG